MYCHVFMIMPSTLQDFEQTLQLVKRYKFPSLFINQFYPRPGTPAARMKRIPTQEVSPIMFNCYAIILVICEGKETQQTANKIVSLIPSLPAQGDSVYTVEKFSKLWMWSPYHQCIFVTLCEH